MRGPGRRDWRRGVALTLAVAWLGWGSAATAPPALAQSAGFDVGGDSAPIEIDASEGIEWRRSEKLYVARGDVRVSRGSLSLYADTLTARYRDDNGGTRIWRIEAAGNVRLSSAEETVFGTRAVYDLDKDVVVFEGPGLKLETPKNLLTAEGSFEFWTKRNVLVARGGALAVDGERQVRADSMTGYFRKNDEGRLDLFQVEASGNVRISGKGGTVRGSKAIYDLDKGIATLTGGVRITKGQAQLNGDRAEVNLRTGVARLLGAPGGGRVRTLIVPSAKPAP
jgi:lipopolysaccharide export system protein LptA